MTNPSDLGIRSLHPHKIKQHRRASAELERAYRLCSPSITSSGDDAARTISEKESDVDAFNLYSICTRPRIISMRPETRYTGRLRSGEHATGSTITTRGYIFLEFRMIKQRDVRMQFEPKYHITGLVPPVDKELVYTSHNAANDTIRGSHHNPSLPR